MCGIAGYFGTGGVSEQQIQDTIALMQNRGPDGQAFRCFAEQGMQVALIHARLSIIDLEDRANQPFHLNDCWLIFNGEIYNYLELRSDLEKLGHVFRTESDTEVLLRAYLEYGEDCVKKFEGMWAFAIYDRRQGKLFLSRDRFAEKPLYCLQTQDGLYFGSEIKFLSSLSGRTPTVNIQQVLRFLTNGYKSLYKENETFFLNIHELSCATNMTIDAGLLPRYTTYWHPRSSQCAMSCEDAIEGVKDRLLESMRIRLRADVPLAFCLSGGVDSSALVSIAAKKFNYQVKTFSIIDKDERYDETENIRSTLNDLGCPHEMIEIPQGQLLTRLRTLIRYHDAPVYTISYYIHSFLSEAIAKSGYRVAVSGTAADEIFTGYYDHFNLHLFEMRHHPDYESYLSDWKNNTGKWVRNPYLKNPDLYIDNPCSREHIYWENGRFDQYMTKDFSEPFSERYYCDSLLRNRMMNELFHEGTRTILHEDDLNSMLFSIENRSPYLDSRLVDFAYSIPPEHLIRNGYGKYLLRQALDGILNDKVRLDRQKKGFNASIHSLFNLAQSDVTDYILTDGEIFNYVRKDKIAQLLAQDVMQNSDSKFLFSFLGVKIFLEEFAHTA